MDALIRRFQAKILAFYAEKARDLPWRHTTEAYAILVSEVMLQQTQVGRVVERYERWLARWPSIRALAAASLHEVLQEWSGLGYNRRALLLHKAAGIIVAEHQGDVLLALRSTKIPGIGPYTAAAVRIFAANEDIVAVDTNIRRIFIHEFGHNAAGPARLQELAMQCLPKGRSREWHNALMDYGATFLTARSTGIKPLSRQGRFEGSVRQLRGKVMKALIAAERPVGMKTLSTMEPDTKRLRTALHGLVRDGLARRAHGGYSLPGRDT